MEKRKGKNIAVKTSTVSGLNGNFFSRFTDYSSVWIVLLAIICFGRNVCFRFLDFDDNLFIVDNHKIFADLSNLHKVFDQGIWSLVKVASPYDYYRPFLILSWMIDAQIGGASPVIYHFSNIVYHILACLLLFKLLGKLEIKRETALVLTLLFTVHPVITQAVSWIPGRNDMLLSICIISSFLFFIHYWQTRKIIFLLGHYLLFFFALMTKETALALPLICFLYYAVVLNKKMFTKETLGYVFRWILLLAIYLFIRAKAIGETQNSINAALLIETFMYRFPAILQYIGKAIFPFNLSVKPTQEDTVYYWGIAALLCIVVSLYFSPKKNYRMIVFGAAWFFLFLLTALLLPKNLNDNLFEHRLYLPLIGLLILMSESVLFKNNSLYTRKRILISIGAIALFTFVAIRHTDNFKNGYVFWRNAALNSPHDAEAQFFLGKEYFKRGDALNAEIYLNKTLLLSPEFKRANAGLAVMFAQQGEMEKARMYYEAEVRLGTKDKEVFRGFASVLKELDKPNEAIVYFEKALQEDSTDQDVNEQLASLYYSNRNYPAARQTWERMIRLNPFRPNINRNLAILYYTTGSFEKALSYGTAEERLGGKMPDGFIEDVKRKISELK